MRSLPRWLIVLVANALLSGAVQSLAPIQPGLSDREEYEWVGRHPLEPGCPYSVYCYRILVPAVLEHIPIEPDARWRWFRWSATTAAGSIVALTAPIAPGASGAALATIVVQGSFGFTFTAYDPYSADPFVFVVLATIAWCWMTNRWVLALAFGSLGVLAKETVALINAAAALAALLARHRPGHRLWIAQGVVVAAGLFGFHWVTDTYLGWNMSTNVASRFEDGSWLRLWWVNNPGLLRKLFFLFKTFGFAWLYAAIAFSTAPRELRQLAIGAFLPFLALNYVQNPERALATTFFVIVPLAVQTLGRVPMAIGLTAAISNSAFTTKVGTSSEWLPPSRYLLAAAAVGAVWVLWSLLRDHRGLSLGRRKA